MPIHKILKSPTQVELSYHVLAKIQTSEDFQRVQIGLKGYASELDEKSGAPLAWYWDIECPIGVLTAFDKITVENALVSDPSSPFYGGNITREESDLEKEKRIRWSVIKNQRDAAENAGFSFDGITFDSDFKSQMRIQGLVLMAQLAMKNGSDFIIDFTTADNKTVQLDSKQIIDIGFELSRHVTQIHACGRWIRKKIEQATSIQEVREILWSFDPNEPEPSPVGSAAVL